ncbi:MAG: cytochrome C oxidase subunit IV family protein [Chloroflexi bacterium]|nr:cytochrome C oxidase subunit IV family protein [Chloroflexota bacterium]
MSHQTHAQSHGEHPPTTIREYVMIGLVLTVVTVVELWASYNEEMLGALLVPALFIMSAFKFAVVAAMFMHLRFEHPLLTRLFSFGLILGTAMILALTAIFWTDTSDVVGGIPADAPGAGEALTSRSPSHEQQQARSTSDRASLLCARTGREPARGQAIRCWSAVASRRPGAAGGRISAAT